MFKRIYLFVLKQRLKEYKKSAKWYENKGCYDDFYHEYGIPDLEEEILKLEKEMRLIRND